MPVHMLQEAIDDRVGKLRDLQPSSPKREADRSTTEHWYSYYASYADSFVSEIVEALPKRKGIVLDPWNGSGTTTSVATAHSIPSRGFDLNPAAAIIAKARLMHSDVAGSITPLSDEIVESADQNLALSKDDLLATWLVPSAVKYVRSLERRVHHLLVCTDDDQKITDQNFDEVSSLAALFYLGLFRTVRNLINRFVGSNPTWIKQRIPPAQRARPSQEAVANLFLDTMSELTQRVEEVSHSYDDDSCPCKIAVGSSNALPLESNSLDAVITSPPYCTRIDYVIATLPELALLGFEKAQLRKLRIKMIGTPTVSETMQVDSDFGSRTTAFLTDVSQHPSKASDGYYRKFFSQYLAGMNASLAEIDRVLKDKSPVVLVAQDSYYKDVHVNLPTILKEMGEALGWQPVAEHGFPVPPGRNYAAIHKRGRAYRSVTPATETVLVFTN
jgi:DNA modification methylase